MSKYIKTVKDQYCCVFCSQVLKDEDIKTLPCACEKVHKACADLIYDHQKDLEYVHFCSIDGQSCYQKVLVSHFCKSCEYYLESTVLDCVDADLDCYPKKGCRIGNMSEAQEYFRKKKDEL